MCVEYMLIRKLRFSWEFGKLMGVAPKHILEQTQDEISLSKQQLIAVVVEIQCITYIRTVKK